MNTVKISVTAVKEDLKNGLTRLKSKDNGKGSIEEKYGLTQSEVKRLFNDERLKGIRAKGKSRVRNNFELTD